MDNSFYTELWMITAGMPFYLGGIFQIVKMLKTKSSKNVSILTWGLFVFAQIQWIVYGFLINSTSLIITNVGCVATNSILIYITLKYSDEKFKIKNIFKKKKRCNNVTFMGIDR